MFRSKYIIILILLLSAGIIFQVFAQEKINWNGYLQYRFADNYLDQSQFSVRRAKLWFDGKMPFASNKWSYKVQAIFLNKQNYLFELQDAFINYKIDDYQIKAGQFVPDYSLQRKQPDYVIPLTERATVINALLPSACTMGRDIGFELKYSGHAGGVSIGYFNGNGANSLSNKRNSLYINRGYIKLKIETSEIHIGYSIAYRNDKDLIFSNILGNKTSFTGKDFRYGFDARLKLSGFEFQTEYLEAHLENKNASGYYALADYLITPKNLITLSIEKLNSLNPLTNNNPWYTVGYSHYIKGEEIKISFDNRFQFISSKTNLLTILQIQYFFNQK